MKWLEIIHLRTAHPHLETLLNDLSGPIKSIENKRNLSALKIYRHPRLDTEVIIHLHWNGHKPQVLESALGLRLANISDEYGTTNHSIWIEWLENKGEGKSFLKTRRFMIQEKKNENPEKQHC